MSGIMSSRSRTARHSLLAVAGVVACLLAFQPLATRAGSRQADAPGGATQNAEGAESPGAPEQFQVTFHALADATTMSAAPGTNYGSSETLQRATPAAWKAG